MTTFLHQASWWDWQNLLSLFAARLGARFFYSLLLFTFLPASDFPQFFGIL